MISLQHSKLYVAYSRYSISASSRALLVLNLFCGAQFSVEVDSYPCQLSLGTDQLCMATARGSENSGQIHLLALWS